MWTWLGATVCKLRLHQRVLARASHNRRTRAAARRREPLSSMSRRRSFQLSEAPVAQCSSQTPRPTGGRHQRHLVLFGAVASTSTEDAFLSLCGSAGFAPRASPVRAVWVHIQLPDCVRRLMAHAEQLAPRQHTCRCTYMVRPLESTIAASAGQDGGTQELRRRHTVRSLRKGSSSPV